MVAFWAYLFALRRQWGLMAVLLAICTAARLPAVLFVGLCGLEYMRAHKWRVRTLLQPSSLWFLLAPLGFVAYGLFLSLTRSDFLAMFHDYNLTADWTYHVFNPNIAYTMLKEVYAVYLGVVGARPFDAALMVNSVLPTAGLAILLATSLYCLFVVKDQAVPLGIFGLIATILFTLHNNVVSVHRYLLPCLTIYLATALAATKYTRLRLGMYGAMSVGILLQTYLVFLFVNNNFAG